jgi:hypothetical protein
MVLRQMDERGLNCYANRKEGLSPGKATAPAEKTKAANLPQNAKNMSPSTVRADRPPMTIPRDDKVAGLPCRAILRTRTATVPGATVSP